MFRITSKIPNFDKSVVTKKKTISVRIPKEKEAIYPSKCVVCSGQGADTSVRGVDPLHTYKTFYLFGYESSAPIHNNCKKKLNKSKFIKYTVVALFLCVFLYLTREFPKGIYLTIIFPFVILYLIWETKNPPPYGVTTLGDNIEHTFTNKKYGYEFAELNGITENA